MSNGKKVWEIEMYYEKINKHGHKFLYGKEKNGNIETIAYLGLSVDFEAVKRQIDELSSMHNKLIVTYAKTDRDMLIEQFTEASRIVSRGLALLRENHNEKRM